IHFREPGLPPIVYLNGSEPTRPRLTLTIPAPQHETDSLMPTPIYIVDAFAERPFQGNPAAVCPLERPADAEWMQSVAMEMNLSETAFAVPSATGFNLRWFTPRVEVDLCGHATLATAHLLWEQGLAAGGKPI